MVAFTDQTAVTVPGAAHQQGQQELLYAVYDTSLPRHLLTPGSFAVYATTYNAVVTFALPQSGVVMMAVLTPQYVTAFSTTATPPYEVLIPGSAHALGEPYLFVQAYAAGNPAEALEMGSLTVQTTTFDVLLTFAEPQSGTVVLAVGSPRYVQAFTGQTTVTIPGGVHGLESPNLLQMRVCRVRGGSDADRGRCAHVCIPRRLTWS